MDPVAQLTAGVAALPSRKRRAHHVLANVQSPPLQPPAFYQGNHTGSVPTLALPSMSMPNGSMPDVSRPAFGQSMNSQNSQNYPNINNHFSQPNNTNNINYPNTNYPNTNPNINNFQPTPTGYASGGLAAGSVSLNVATPADTRGLSLSATRLAHHTEYATRPFLSFQNVVPPAAGTQYQAVDQGTATPRHMRSTLYTMPETEALRRATHLPVAVTVRPFAPLQPGEDPVPTVDMTQGLGPPRCNRCRTYINPAMAHTAAGSFTCNVCQFGNNHVPLEYVAPLDASGQRVDRAQRPELHRGVYDIAVPEYYEAGGKAMHHVFLVDVSMASVQRQLPVVAADAIRLAIFGDGDSDSDGDDGNDNSDPTSYSIMLFDSSVHVFNLAPELDTAQLVLSGDLDDPFVPFHHGLFANPADSRSIIEDALNTMEQLAPGSPEPCLAVAVRTAALALQSAGGGKITALLGTLPSWGPGGSRIKENRNVGRSPLAEAERALYAADNEYIRLLGKDLVAQNVGLDILAVADTPTDVSNLGWLCSVTGGIMRKWTSFVFERDGRALTDQLVSSVKKCVGYQGQLKLRCSNGLQVTQYYGFPSGEASLVGLSLDPAVPVLSEDLTFTILLEYDGSLNTKYDCHFQAAVLYTDRHGTRKVRVVNLVLAVSERLQDVFSFVDQDAVVATVLRDTLSFVGKELLVELRKSVSEKLVQIFTLYRAMSEQNHNMNSTRTNQLIFPDSLKHLPLYFLALLKSRAMRDSSSISIDSRLCDVYDMMSMPLERLAYHLYPALVELHSLADTDCYANGVSADAEENPEEFVGESFLRLPEFKPLTAQSLEPGVYILCNGTTVYVWVHPDANKLLLRDLFGEHIRSVDDIDPYLDLLPELPTNISQQARNLVQYFQKEIIGSGTISSSAIRIVRQGIDSWAHEFRECLVEDHLPSKTVNTSPTLPEFLASLHRAIQGKVDVEKKHIQESTKHDETFVQRMLHF